MPLYQPSNITPSTFAGVGGGTVDAQSSVNITWQVNGNVPLTAFKIDFYTGGAQSTLVHSTGIINSGYGLPFYGIDENGDPVFFTFSPSVTYASYGLANGNEYNYKITQYFGGQTTADYTIEQFSENVFITRAAPTLSIDDFGGQISVVAYTFTATYAQAQGDTINTVHWILTDTTANEVVKDTGIVRTPILSFTFQGFISGHEYTLSCEVQTESGATTSAKDDFSCEYAQTASTNEVSLSCAGNGGISVTFGGAVDIPGVASSEDGYTITGQTLYLNAGETITWDTVDGAPMQFSAPYTVSWRGKPQDAYAMTDEITSTSALNNVRDAVFSPDGTKFAILTAYTVYVYACSGGYIALIGTTGTYSAVAAAWTADGEKLIVGGGDTTSANGAYLAAYTVTDTSVSLAQAISQGEDGAFTALEFSEDGGKLYAARAYSSSRPQTYIYTYSGGTFTETSDNFSSAIVYQTRSTVRGICLAGGKMICYGQIRQNQYWLCVSDAETLVAESTLTADGNVYNVKGGVTADGTLAALNIIQLGSNGELLIFDLVNGIEQTQTFSGISGKNISLSADGNTLAVGGNLYGFNGKTGKYQFFGAISTDKYSILSESADIFVSIETEERIKLYSAAAVELISAGGIQISQNGIFAQISDGNNTESLPFSGAADTLLLYYRNDDENVFGSVSLSADETPLYSQEVGVSVVGGDIADVVISGAQTANFINISSAFPYSTAYTPQWGADTLFYARFADDLQAGTISASGVLETAIYRSENGKLVPLLRVPTAVTSIIDYGVTSGNAVGYTTYYVDGNTYSSPTASEDAICLNMRAYYLYECTQDATNPNVYHVQKIFAFGNNTDGGAISNNNTPGFLENFTRYPTRQPSAQMPKSGVLSAMLSNVGDGTYADTAAQMEALYNLSASANTFFLKDKKGNLYMVGLDGAITQQIAENSAVMEVSVSIPWREVGDARGKAIIQTTLDAAYGQGAINASTKDNGCAIPLPQQLTPAEEVYF